MSPANGAPAATDGREMSMNVMSVAGPVKAEDLGRTLVHEHVVITMPGEELDPAYGPDRREVVAMATDQLQKLKDHGVSSLVDPCPIELGRNPELYAEVSQRSGVNIIFSTGFYFEAMGIPLYWRARDADEIADFYLKELTDGVGKTGLRPGVIKAATGMDFSPNEQKCLSGAAMAQRQADCAIITHTEHSRHGDRQQQTFAENGANMARVMIGHQDEQTSPEPILALAQRGTFVAVDRIGLDSLASDDTRADNVAAVVKAGFVRQMCLSHDCVCSLTAPRFPFPMPKEKRPQNPAKSWAEKQKPLTFLLTDFLPKLKARGVTDADIDTMLRDNPRRLLTGAA
jgi:phosphotriesterase-related protein